MSSASRVLNVLQLFSEDRVRLRVTEVMEQLCVSSATAYRYMAELEAAGLVARASASEFVLGSKIVELDRVIRENDPLIAAAADVMKTLSERTGGTVLLCRLHGHKVMCVHQVRGRLAPPSVSYERGKAMPLFRGATSKAILVRLPASTLDGFVAPHGADLRAAGLPTTSIALRAALAAMRDSPVLSSRGEVDPQAVGWAMALHSRKKLLGSLSLVLSQASTTGDPARLADQLRRAALRIEGRLDN